MPQSINSSNFDEVMSLGLASRDISLISETRCPHCNKRDDIMFWNKNMLLSTILSSVPLVWIKENSYSKF